MDQQTQESSQEQVTASENISPIKKKKKKKGLIIFLVVLLIAAAAGWAVTLWNARSLSPQSNHSWSMCAL